MTEAPDQPYDRAAEVDAILRTDDTLLGRIFRYDLEGKTPLEMASAEGNSHPGFVYNYRPTIAALRTGEIPSSPTISLGTARRVRTWLKRRDLSSGLRGDLTKLESQLVSRAEDRSAQEEEEDQAVGKTQEAEAAGVPGVYVYTLPHYLRYPYDTETKKTMLKVGHSSVDAHYRAGSQGRLTALPEDPILLRIYPVNESAKAEREFHAWLRDADHVGSRTRRGGSEWYVTSTKFLDRIARSMGLDIKVVTEFEAGED